ncbi:trehalose utilization protein [Chthoniobacter flavus]|nr:ThuA domain-containing protein [Chthoniobacter flavus]TCO86757.1 trehalose utilization protein [Chthoniobacter flavus]
MKTSLVPTLALSVLTLAAVASSQAAEPIKVLLVTGGCCHDYAKQKDILKAGIEKRANAKVDIIFTADFPMGANGKPDATKPNLPIYGHPDYAKGYDVVIHDECSAGISDQKVVEGVLAPHREGIPGVNLHCAMHCYRIGNPNDAVTDLDAPHAYWFKYLGLQSSGHGPQKPIDVKILDKESPITKGMSDWTTINEEHYNNIKILDTAHPLAHGLQVVSVKKKDADGKETTEDKTMDWVDIWTNLYNGKTRVFSTTLGHNDDTVADPRYLDLVTRGLLWATNHINADGTPATGYGPGGK